jgi:small-conductance mechanosensitive channel
VGHLVISLSSMLLAFTFVFGNSIRQVYESVVLLFVVNPYEVGDTILHNGRHHVVESFGLLTTQLIQDCGHAVWVCMPPLEQRGRHGHRQTASAVGGSALESCHEHSVQERMGT